MSRLDALTVREKDGKSFWTRIGVAFPAKSGSGWTVLLDAMPAPTEGQYKILLREPQQREERPDRARQEPPGGGLDPDDSIPFGPEWRI